MREAHELLPPPPEDWFAALLLPPPMLPVRGAREDVVPVVVVGPRGSSKSLRSAGGERGQ